MPSVASLKSWGPSIATNLASTADTDPLASSTFAVCPEAIPAAVGDTRFILLFPVLTEATVLIPAGPFAVAGWTLKDEIPIILSPADIPLTSSLTLIKVAPEAAFCDNVISKSGLPPIESWR